MRGSVREEIQIKIFIPKKKNPDFISLIIYYLTFQFNFNLIPTFENDYKLHFKNYCDDTFEKLWAFKYLNFEQF